MHIILIFSLTFIFVCNIYNHQITFQAIYLMQSFKIRLNACSGIIYCTALD